MWIFHYTFDEVVVIDFGYTGCLVVVLSFRFGVLRVCCCP